MEQSENINVSDLVMAVKFLPIAELETLLSAVNNEILLKSRNSPSNLRQILLKAPTWSDEDLERYQNARDHINRSRLA